METVWEEGNCIQRQRIVAWGPFYQSLSSISGHFWPTCDRYRIKGQATQNPKKEKVLVMFIWNQNIIPSVGIIHEKGALIYYWWGISGNAWAVLQNPEASLCITLCLWNCTLAYSREWLMHGPHALTGLATCWVCPWAVSHLLLCRKKCWQAFLTT